ncbi:MAG: hypothetical protein MRY79_05250 [Alphaproteobacteria bacterium]|nr:hypothetical protein [Alphaproteobacteria bacterium]
MLRISALLTGIYLTICSSAHAAGEHVPSDKYLHGETAHKLEEGIYEAEHASSGGLPQFDPTWFASQVFWLAISFAILYFFFAKKTLPDISSVIENRKNHIQADIESAEKLTAEADSVQEAYQKGLEKSQNQAAKVIQDTETKMKEKAARSFDEFRERSESRMKEAEERIAESTETAMDEMNQMAAEVASIAVEKIIGQPTDAGSVKTLIDNMDGKKKAKAA